MIRKAVMLWSTCPTSENYTIVWTNDRTTNTRKDILDLEGYSSNYQEVFNLSQKKVDVANRYSHEIQNISNTLKQLENGHIYELTEVTMHGSIAHNISQLRKMLNELLNKIENDKPGFHEKIDKWLRKTKDSE